jgi:hypothetical protein
MTCTLMAATPEAGPMTRWLLSASNPQTTQRIQALDMWMFPGGCCATDKQH